MERPPLPVSTRVAIAVLVVLSVWPLAGFAWLVATEGGVPLAVAVFFVSKPLVYLFLAAALTRRARWAWWGALVVVGRDLLVSLIAAVHAVAVILQGDFASSGRTAVGVVGLGAILVGLLRRESRAAFEPRAS